MVKSTNLYPIIGLLLIATIIYTTYAGSNEYSDEDYYNKVGLELEGIVKTTVDINFGHGYHIADILVVKSNMSNYDKRNDLRAHLGVIDSGKAQIVFNGTLKKGDSIVIDKREYKIYRHKELIEKSILTLPKIDYFNNPFKDINKKIELLNIRN